MKPRPGRWTKAQRRQQIAEITLDLIGHYGVRGATVGRIARAAGISTPALYNHFTSKDQILDAALEVLLERTLEWLHSSDNPDMLERLRELFGPVHEAKVAADPHWLVLPLFEFTLSTAAAGPVSPLGSGQATVLQTLIDFIEAGKEQGTVRPDADAEVAAWSLIGLGWTADFAGLQGLDHFLSAGTSRRILDRILADIAAEPK